MRNQIAVALQMKEFPDDLTDERYGAFVTILNLLERLEQDSSFTPDKESLLGAVGMLSPPEVARKASDNPKKFLEGLLFATQGGINGEQARDAIAKKGTGAGSTSEPSPNVIWWDTSSAGLVYNLPSVPGQREQLITDEKVFEEIVDPPLIEACKILFRKGIGILSSSANGNDRLNGAAIEIDPRSLSAENKAIAENMTSRRKESGYLVKQYPEIWILYIPFERYTTIGELSEKVCSLVNLFAPQNSKIEGSPAECLEMIKDNAELIRRARITTEGITVSEVASLRPYDLRTVYREFEILKDVGIFVPVEGRPRHYRFSDMMLGADENYTKTLINMINDIEYQVGKGGEKRPLRRGNIRKGKRPLVKELIQLHITSFVHMQIKEAEVAEKPYTIKIWKGYGTPAQQGLMTRIEKMSQDKPYQIGFERDIESLVNYACDPGNINERTVTILPLDKNLLTPEQQKRLEDAKARVIFVNPDEEGFGAFDSAPLEGLIAAGRAYLNDDEEAFYRLYELLAQPEGYNPIPLAELKNNPALFINALKFTLKPITAHDPDELRAINERMEKLLQSA